MNKPSIIDRHQKNPSINVEISMTQTNNTIIQQTSIILLQTNNNKLKYPTSIKEIERILITNKERKKILQDMTTAKTIPNNNSRYSNHPSKKNAIEKSIKKK